MHPSRIEIDLEQFRKNIWTIRKCIGKSKLCLPVKANAYGHGLLKISQAAEEAGVDCLGVSCLKEGAILRENGIKIPILVLGAIHESQIDLLAKYDLEFSISSKFKADLVASRLKSPCKVHLEVDTGMQRTGVRIENAKAFIQHVKSHPLLKVVGIYSHFATADKPKDPFVYKQLSAFIELKGALDGATFHIANSGGTLFYPESHLDMVRAGLIAYGYLPKKAPQAFKEIAPFFSLKSKISYFKVVEKDRGISYAHTYKTKAQTRIVTVPVGYGDGFLRAFSRNGSVLIGGKRFPIAGNICMDQFMVDIGEASAYVGDEVVLIGKQGEASIPLMELAKRARTIPYEVLCLFNDRIPREYHF